MSPAKLLQLLCGALLPSTVVTASCEEGEQCTADKLVGLEQMKGHALLQTGSDSELEKTSAILEEESEVRVLSDAAAISNRLALLALPFAAARQRLIIDTDAGLDVDDIVAICIANAMHKSGEIELLGIVHNTGFPIAVGGISAIQHWWGHDDVPIGAFKGEFGREACNGCGGALGQDQYHSDLIRRYNPPIKDYHDAKVWEAKDLYRKLLAEAPDNSVNIASIGFLTNLKALVTSKGDKYSSLSGKDLIAKKVGTIVYMDGGYNFGCAGGLLGAAHECWSSSRDTVYAMPYGQIKQYFSLLAGDVVSGKRMFNAGQCPNVQGSPCKQALADNHSPHGLFPTVAPTYSPHGQGGTGGRSSWDPYVTLIASRGLGQSHAQAHDVNVYIEPNGDETYPTCDNPGQQKVDYHGSPQRLITKDIDDLLCAARSETNSSVTV